MQLDNLNLSKQEMEELANIIYDTIFPVSDLFLPWEEAKADDVNRFIVGECRAAAQEALKFIQSRVGAKS